MLFNSSHSSLNYWSEIKNILATHLIDAVECKLPVLVDSFFPDQFIDSVEWNLEIEILSGVSIKEYHYFLETHLISIVSLAFHS